MTTVLTDTQLGLDQSSVDKFLAKFIDKMKLSSASDTTYEETIELMAASYESTGADASVVKVIRDMKTDAANKKLWDDMQKLVTEGDETLLAAPAQTNEAKSVKEILDATNVPELTSLDDWSNYISGSGTTLGGWMSGGPAGILSTTDSAIKAALEKRFNPVNNYRRFTSYSFEQTILRTDLPSSPVSMEDKLHGLKRFDAESTEAFNARSKGAKKASNAFGQVSKGVGKLTTGLSLGQGAVDIVSGINKNDHTRIAGGAIAMTGAVVSIGDSIAKKASPTYKAAAGALGDMSKKGAKAAHFAPVAGGLIAVAAGVVSVVKNSQAANDAFASGNNGRGAMFTTMAVLDSIAIVVDIIGTIADFIPGIGTAISVICDLISTIIGMISDLIGLFTELVDTRSDDEKVQQAFDAYLKSTAFTEYIDKLAAEYKNQGYDLLVYMTDAEAAEVDAGGVDLEAHNTKMEKVERDLTTKMAGTIYDMRRMVKLDATGQSNTIVGGDAADLLQVVRDRVYLGEATKLLKGLGGNDRIIGGNGPDTIIGGTGNDKLYSRDGEDYLFGMSGDDYLVPGDQAVSAIGGLGHDVVVLNEGVTLYSGGTIGTGTDTLLISGDMASETYYNSSTPYPGRVEIDYKTNASMKVDVKTVWPDPYSTTAYNKHYPDVHAFEKVYIDTKGRFANIDLAQYRSEPLTASDKTLTTINFAATGGSHGNTGNLVDVKAVLEEGSHTLQFANVGNGIRGTLFGYAENSSHIVTMASDTANLKYVFIDKDDHGTYNVHYNDKTASVFKLGKVDSISLINSATANFPTNAVREFDFTNLSETSPNVIVALSKGTVKLQTNSFCNALLSWDTFQGLSAITTPLNLIFGPDKSNLLDLSHTTGHKLDISTETNNIKLNGSSTVRATFNNVTNFSLGQGQHTLRSPLKFANVTLNGGGHDVSAAEFSQITSYAGNHKVSLGRESTLAIAASGDTIGKTVTLDIEILKPVTSNKMQLDDYVVKINGTPITEHYNLPKSADVWYDNLWFPINKEKHDFVRNMMMYHATDPNTLQQVQDGMLIRNNADVQRYKDRASPFFISGKHALNFSLDALDNLTKSFTGDTTRYSGLEKYNFKVMFYTNTRNTVALSNSNAADTNSTLKFIGINDLHNFIAEYDNAAQTLNLYCRNPDSQKEVVAYNTYYNPVISYPVSSANLRSGIEALCSYFSTVVIDQTGTGENERAYDIEAFKSVLFYQSEIHNSDLGLSSSLLSTFTKGFSPNNTMSFFIDGVGDGVDSTKVFDSRITDIYSNSGSASGDREYIDLLSTEQSNITCKLDFNATGKCIAWIDPSKGNQWHIYSPTGAATRLTVLILSGVTPEQVSVTSSGSETHIFNVNNTAKIHWYGAIKPDIVYFKDTKKLYTGLNVGNQYTAPRSQAGGGSLPAVTVLPENLILDAHLKSYDGQKWPQPNHIVMVERHTSFNITHNTTAPGSIVAEAQTNAYVGLQALVSGQTYVLSVKGELVPGPRTPLMVFAIMGNDGSYGNSLGYHRTEAVLNADTIYEFEFTADGNNAVLEINNVKQTLNITGIIVTPKTQQVVNVFPDNIVLDEHLKSSSGIKWPQDNHMVLVERGSWSIVYNSTPPASLAAGIQTNTYLGLPALVSGKTYLITVNGSITGSGSTYTFCKVRGDTGYSGIQLVEKQVTTVLNANTITEFEFVAGNERAVLEINNVDRTLNLSSVTITTK